MLMIYTINVRDSSDKLWARFWKAEQGIKPVKRFGFRLAFDSDRKADVERLEQTLKDEMKKVKQILRYEDSATMTTGYQTMNTTKSSTATANAMRRFATFDKHLGDCLRSLEI